MRCSCAREEALQIRSGKKYRHCFLCAVSIVIFAIGTSYETIQSPQCPEVSIIGILPSNAPTFGHFQNGITNVSDSIVSSYVPVRGLRIG